jgi:hydrogenase/urease accessory protein HupE
VRSYVVDPENPVLELAGASSAASAADLLQLFLTYTRLGIEHILSGIDHLLFVLGLLLLVGFRRNLVWTVTAFTAAHSITLGASALELVQVPTAPVEATIALSILLVAAECAKPGTTVTRRAPWAVAFAFGLLHGFGFAGALAEFGLPPNHVALALGGFNLGVELGQLLALGVVFAIWLGIRRAPRIVEAQPVLVYAMGTLAAYWSIERISQIWLAG